MIFTDKKIETAILGFAIVLIGGMSYLLKPPIQGALEGIANIVYEMPRPKGSLLASLFNLDDRDIERKYVNPFAKKEVAEKKAAEVKKETAAVAKQALQAAAKKQEANANKKPKVDVKIVGSRESKKWEEDGFFTTNGSGRYAQSNAKISPQPGEIDTNPKKETLTTEEWRRLLASEPTPENINKLIVALTSNEVDSTSFYAIVKELFISNKTENQALALSAMKAVYNGQSFILTAQSLNLLTPELLKDAEDYLNSYASVGRLPMLALVLKGEEVVAITIALEVAMGGHEAARTETPMPNDSRGVRGDITTNSLTEYNQFIPIFQQLATSSSDAAIANLANRALGQIQSTIAAL